MADAYEYRDALPAGPCKGRGAGLNPGNRFETVRLHVLGEALDEAREAERLESHCPPPRTQVLPDHARTLINHVDPVKSPDIAMRWTINPYRGCEHGCNYCYARPTHEYLGYSSGLDFETKLLARHDAPAMLRKELAARSWRGEPIVMSGVTDPYQPIERQLRITRGCLEVMAECRQPVGLITKNRLVTRDIDLLAELARYGAVGVSLSITTLDHKLAAAMEPRASSPADRLKAIEQLAQAGVSVGVMVAPVVPGLTDQEMPAILKAAAEAGATSAGWVLLRLPHQVKAVFLEWVGRQYPERAGRVEALLREMRGGKLYEADAFVRRRGRGPMAGQIAEVFKVFARRHGLNRQWEGLSGAAFRRPSANGQMPLF